MGRKNNAVYVVALLLLIVAIADAEGPPGLQKPSHATCSIKKYKHCYNLVHVCPKFCPETCHVECVSCKPICGPDPASPPKDEANPPPNTGGEGKSPPPPEDDGKGKSPPPSDDDGKGKGDNDNGKGKSPPPSNDGKGKGDDDNGKGKSPPPSDDGKGKGDDDNGKGKSPPPSNDGKGKGDDDNGKGKSPPPSDDGKGNDDGKGKSPPPSDDGKGKGDDGDGKGKGGDDGKGKGKGDDDGNGKPSSPPSYPPPSPTPSPPKTTPPSPTPTPPTPTPASPPPPTPTPPTPTTPPRTPPYPTPTPTPSSPPPPTPTPPTPTTPPTTPPSPTPTPPTPTPPTPTPTPPTPAVPTTPPTTPPSPSPRPPTPSTPPATPPTSTPPTPPASPPMPPAPVPPAPPGAYVPVPSESGNGLERHRCKNKKYTQCYGVEHVCPASCPSTCEIDCVTCKPVCKCDMPGAVCEDPRFIGGDGITFYFHGKRDRDFCLVTDPNLHINAHFIGRRNANMRRDFTWVQSIAILFGDHQLFLGAQKTAAWDSTVDRFSLSFDGEPIALSASEGATWRSAATSITRDSDTNSIVIQVDGLLKISAKVVPITVHESRVHNYGITEEDCFAHLELAFKFFSLSANVNGVLGQTYRENYVSRVKMGVPMPLLGGERDFAVSNIFAPDCAASLFRRLPENDDALLQLPTMKCGSGINGRGVVCKR